MIPGAKLANADQLASVVESVAGSGSAAGSRAVDIRVWNGIDLRLLPDRGLDIGAAWFRGTPLAWISQTGEQAPPDPEALVDRAWGDFWGGGLVTTCGLSNVGEASEGYGLHGTYTARPAGDLQLERSTSEVTATATVVDAPFTLSRRIVTTVGQGLVRLDDRIVNESEWTAAAPLLYHVNIGAPLWDDDAYLETDAVDVVPRDDAAAAGLATWDEPPSPVAGGVERVFEHVGASLARLTNPRVGLELTVRSSLPRLWQWVAPGSRDLCARLRARKLLRARPRARHRGGANAVSRPGRSPDVLAHDPGATALRDARSPVLHRRPSVLVVAGLGPAVLFLRSGPQHEVENRADDRQPQDPQQPQQLRADPEIVTPDQADDRIAPEDDDGDDEHEQEDPLGAAESEHRGRGGSHAREPISPTRKTGRTPAGVVAAHPIS